MGSFNLMSQSETGNQSPKTDNRLLLLDPNDNVLGVARSIRAGEAFPIEGQYVRLDRPAGIGFKVARIAIRKGDSIKKYGAVIGVASADIGMGQLVHVHNTQSNYMANTLVTGTIGDLNS
ncbi:MAG: hypothetical protein ACJAZW_000090 [Maritalea sp.]|jgi:hypothetical protein